MDVSITDSFKTLLLIFDETWTFPLSNIRKAQKPKQKNEKMFSDFRKEGNRLYAQKPCGLC